MAIAAEARPVLVRVRGLGEVYEPSYRWDGSCECGANAWETRLWEEGYSVHCRACGWWECSHEFRGVSHTSDGRWAGGRVASLPPSGCPCLQNGP